MLLISFNSAQTIEKQLKRQYKTSALSEVGQLGVRRRKKGIDTLLYPAKQSCLRTSKMEYAVNLKMPFFKLLVFWTANILI